MDFAFDAKTGQLRAELLDFMVSHVHPAEPVFAEQLAALDNRWAWSTVPVLGELRERAWSRGLWNLFLFTSPAASRRTRSPSLGCTSSTCSPADSSC